MSHNKTLILHLVAQKAGLKGFRRFYPFIFAGKDGRDAAYDINVLRDVDIEEFMLASERINLHTPFRPFFEKCLNARNPTTLYMEAIRLATNGGPMDQVLELLKLASPDIKYASFASSIFFYCLEDLEAAIAVMGPLCRSHPYIPLYTTGEVAEAEHIGRMIFYQIFTMGRIETGRFQRTWCFQPIPKCVQICEREPCDCIGGHCKEDVGCGKCFFTGNLYGCVNFSDSGSRLWKSLWKSLWMCEFL